MKGKYSTVEDAKLQNPIQHPLYRRISHYLYCKKFNLELILDKIL